MGTKPRHAGGGTGAAPPPPPPAAPAPARAATWSFRRLGPLWLLLAVAVVHAASHMDVGVDTWVSLAGGRHILAHGVDAVEPFSFNSRPATLPGSGLWAWLHPEGWINQNWLTHVVLASANRAFGLNALVALKYLTYALVATLLLITARERRAHPVPAILLAAGALLAGRTFFEIRAQDATNLLACALMLILTLAVLRGPRAAPLLVPLFALWGNTHGGFVWGLLAVAAFLAGGVAAARVGAPLLAVPAATLRRLALAGAGAVAAVVVLSPYRIANLTHPLAITAGAEAREWRNVFEWLPLSRATTGEQAVFALAVAAALAAAIAASRPARGARSTRGAGARDEDRTRALDLGGAAVLALTVVMAVSSRRFVPMVYLVGAPLLAQWLTGAGERLLAGRTPARRPQPGTPAAATGRRLRLPLLWAGAVAVAALWANAYARTFFGPWPFDERRVGLGDRTLQTVGQPWDACEFVARARVGGRMWAFWDAGGFWAGCQPADPDTGRVAAQISIDGRAQAAYPADVHRWYNLLDAGGPVGLGLERLRRAPTEDETAAIRAFVGKQLTADGIWLAHVAEKNQNSKLSVALFSLPNWQVVYLDARHAILADTATEQGSALAAAVDAGTAEFPTPASRLLTRAHRALLYGGDGGERRALTAAREAYALHPTPRAIAIATTAAREPSCRADALAFCRQATDETIAGHQELARRHGYHQRLPAAAQAALFRPRDAHSRGDDAAARAAGEQLRWLAQEANRLVPQSEW